MLANWLHARSSAHGRNLSRADAIDGRQWVPAAGAAADDFHLVCCADAGPASARQLAANDGSVKKALVIKSALISIRPNTFLETVAVSVLRLGLGRLAVGCGQMLFDFLYLE